MVSIRSAESEGTDPVGYFERKKQIKVPEGVSCGNRSIAECKDLAWERVKAAAIEQATDSLIESIVEISNGYLTKEKIRSSFVGEISSIEILENGFVGESGYFYTILAEVTGKTNRKAEEKNSNFFQRSFFTPKKWPPSSSNGKERLMEEKIKELIENLIAQLPKNKRSISICYEKCVDSSGGSNASLQQVTNKLYSLLAYKFPINAKRSDAKIICEYRIAAGFQSLKKNSSMSFCNWKQGICMRQIQSGINFDTKATFSFFVPKNEESRSNRSVNSIGRRMATISEFRGWI